MPRIPLIPIMDCLQCGKRLRPCLQLTRVLTPVLGPPVPPEAIIVSDWTNDWGYRWIRWWTPRYGMGFHGNNVFCTKQCGYQWAMDRLGPLGRER